MPHCFTGFTFLPSRTLRACALFLCLPLAASAQKNFAALDRTGLPDLPPSSLESSSASDPEPVVSTNAVVEVVAAKDEVAAAQIHLAEQQRVLGVIPNFYASYIWDAAPLTRRQKFSLAWKFTGDPVNLFMAGVVAGTEQSSDTLAGYGQGTRGYARRFGATYADGFSSTMLGQAILPSLLHQDPRYFVKGTGSIRSRALYSVSTIVICKGDNGRWQPNYSNVLGNLGASAISNIYYPASSRHGAGLTIQNSLIGTAFGATGNLIQEFLLHHLTPNLPNYNATN